MTVRSKTLQPKTWAQKAPQYIQEAKVLGVEINPPSINASEMDFTIHSNQVYFGFNAIRDVGRTAARSIFSARGKKLFVDVYDFLERVNLQKVTIKTFQSLIKAGAFDKLGYQRQELLEQSTNLYSYVRDVLDYEQRKIDAESRKIDNEKVTKLIDERNSLRKELKKEQRKLKKAEENSGFEIEALILTIEEKLQPLEEMKLRRLPELKQKDQPIKIELNRYKEVPLTLSEIMEQAHYIGCYVNTHPALLINNGCEALENVWVGQKVKVCGVVNNVKEITTRTGKKMAFLEIDDATEIGEVTVFPRQWARNAANPLKAGDLLRLEVKVEQEEPVIKLIAESIQRYEEN
tara:strand:+ start:1900 stop:2943 length:1044 start_codon:yes stop_codon:yes gene_type:complete